MSDLGPRLASAVVMIILALGALWLGGRWFVAFWLVAASAIFWEWLGLIGAQNRLFKAGLGACVFAILAALTAKGVVEFAMVVLVLVAIAAAAAERGRKPVWAAAGMIYAGSLMIAVTGLRLSLWGGAEAILWLFAVVWGTDILAYFGGRLIGGPKLWPRVSPKKTWSGFLTGVFGGALAGTIVLMNAMPAGQQSVLAYILIGLAAGAISQGGDLLESSIKRHFDVKDSSNLIPGHGGFMDRLDGFITACVCAALLGMARGGGINPATGLLIW